MKQIKITIITFKWIRLMADSTFHYGIEYLNWPYCCFKQEASIFFQQKYIRRERGHTVHLCYTSLSFFLFLFSFMTWSRPLAWFVLFCSQSDRGLSCVGRLTTHNWHSGWTLAASHRCCAGWRCQVFPKYNNWQWQHFHLSHRSFHWLHRC